MSTDIKLSIAQISKMIQYGGSFGSWLSNLRKKVLTSIAIPLARDNLLGLVSNFDSNGIKKSERKIKGKGAVRAGKEFALFMNDTLYEWYYWNHKIVRRFGCINWWSYWNSKKLNKKNMKTDFLELFLAALAASLVQPVTFTVVKGISGREVRRVGREYMDGMFWNAFSSMENSPDISRFIIFILVIASNINLCKWIPYFYISAF